MYCLLMLTYRRENKLFKFIGWSNACLTYIKFENGKSIKERLNEIKIGIAFLKIYRYATVVKIVDIVKLKDLEILRLEIFGV